jgi:ABC-2 type transport system ATP-binding protein
MMTHAVETTDLTRVFGRREAVSGMSLRVPAGTVFALIGPNGAGKTTTMRLLMNLLRPTRGSARVLGVDARELGPAHYERIGYVSENQQLPDWMTLPQLIDHCRPLYRSWDDELLRTLQAELGLNSSERLDRMSRGTRMKAALLVSLAYRPELLVLDEPFTGLDPLVREELVRGLLEVPDDRRPWTIFLSSHDVDEVERLADWIGFMSAGRLLFAEPVASLLARFRRVEVVAAGEPAELPARAEWLPDGRSGRTLRFIDAAHDAPDAGARIAAAFPSADVNAFPMSLREIFVALARRRQAAEAI